MQRRRMKAHILILVFVTLQGIARSFEDERTLIVQFKSDISASEVQDFAKRYGLDMMNKVYGNYYSFLDKNQDSDSLTLLASDTKVKWVDYETEEMYTLLSTDVNTWETIKDPMWRTQKWYLSEQPFNAKSGWEHCYTGRGVTIGLLDNGVLDHPDLSVDRALSKNFWGNVPVQSRSHGTQVAGVASAKSNNLCGIGVAPQASIADLRVFGQKSTLKTTHLMEALSYKPKDIHIYSNSWTISNSGISVGGPKKPVLDILEEGTKLGRDGKGSVYLWGTGNGGPTGDSCAYDGYSNSVFTLGITAVDRNKHMLKSGENCSATFAAAPSQNTGGTEIVTTFGTDKCTKSFSRCSAAVPMASGAIALVMEENPNLTWRDIKHLLARSGSKDGLLPNNFEENAAGYKVSPTFGFGELDIGRLINMAHPDNWWSVGGWKEMKHCVVEPNIKWW
ncbi:furin-1 [Lingula anatina]|uniref:Furin-1 n=1 Tax=Lingula anatina TaxID=7574 RepID=A0A1S3HN10_LINAN|nr:furin-1 [Lingula anatina]|eukprot:XP_013386896.1 furin-1 [Lingula anatina]